MSSTTRVSSSVFESNSGTSTSGAAGPCQRANAAAAAVSGAARGAASGAASGAAPFGGKLWPPAAAPSGLESAMKRMRT